jgi:proline iminopeptidase
MRKIPAAFLACGLQAAALHAHGAAANRELKLPETTLHVEVLGTAAGRPLVLVNGGPGFDHAYLHACDVWTGLAAERPVVLYDQRGNGRSTPLASLPSCTLADQIDDLDAVRADLGAETIDLLGHSWGGFLAMAYAARHPERIHRLILVDSGAPRLPDTLYMFDQFYPDVMEKETGLDFAVKLGDHDADEKQTRIYLSMLFYTPEARDAFVGKADGFAWSHATNLAVHADADGFDLGPELKKFGFPVLVVTGRYDANVAPLTAWRIHQAIPGSRFLVFERSGHLPFCEEPAAFVRAVREFLAAP